MNYKLYTLDNQFIEEVLHIRRNFTGIVAWPYGKQWFANGKLHRIDGPAVEQNNGTKEWWVDGKPVTEEQCNLLHSIMRLKGLI